MTLLRILFLLNVFLQIDNATWPITYQRSENRPPNEKFCQAQNPFCLGGYSKNLMPKFDVNDTIEVFAMKAPVWEQKYGSLLKYFNIMHDAIGIRSVKTKRNFTLEWYELDQLLNCTFPHLINNQKLIWCNQGAACVTQGIDDIHWTENGTLVKVAEMTGKQYQNYSEFVLWDNRTGIYYETWTVRSLKEGRVWFNPHDCSTFVLNSFQKMHSLGVKFNKSVSLNYSVIELISDMPFRLGNITHIEKNPSLYQDLLKFYSNFKPHLKPFEYIENIISIMYDVLWEKKFYLFYNYEYWQLPMVPPYVKLTYNEIPLPQ